VAADELLSGRHNPNNAAVLILMSDGEQTVAGDPVAQANLAKNKGIYLISIGLGSADTATLRTVASSPSDYYYAPNSTVLNSIFSSIAGTVGCDPQLFLPILQRRFK
jgi:hypothetical protein